jgi:putative ABC transport system ATP-binding protein
MEILHRVAHEQGTAVVVVTHDQRSLDVFDAIYQIEDGRLSGPVGRPESFSSGMALSKHA